MTGNVGTAEPDCCYRNEHLTDRHVEVIALIAAGLSDRQVARRLDVGLATVRHHLATAMQRAAAHSRTELVAICYAAGILQVQVWPPVSTSLRCLRNPVPPAQRAALLP
ncbi:response regulator transcription factor [Spongisporangium articulatum]|uniref:Response regulator transcription factor n=1 Tax=Spongisporangium articulatum TaxID=3362603 RepID=A0ABW8ASB1_9ACTN